MDAILKTDAIVVTVIVWDEDTDGVTVLHNGEIAWQEQSWAYADQYFRHYAPKGVPIILEVIG